MNGRFVIVAMVVLLMVALGLARLSRPREQPQDLTAAHEFAGGATVSPGTEQDGLAYLQDYLRNDLTVTRAVSRKVTLRQVEDLLNEASSAPDRDILLVLFETPDWLDEIDIRMFGLGDSGDMNDVHAALGTPARPPSAPPNLAGPGPWANAQGVTVGYFAFDYDTNAFVMSGIVHPNDPEITYQMIAALP